MLNQQIKFLENVETSLVLDGSGVMILLLSEYLLNSLPFVYVSAVIRIVVHKVSHSVLTLSLYATQPPNAPNANLAECRVLNLDTPLPGLQKKILSGIVFLNL